MRSGLSSRSGSRPGFARLFGVAALAASSCGAPAESPAEPLAERSSTPSKAEELELVAVVADCDELRKRADQSDEDLALVPELCPGLVLDRADSRRILLAAGSARAVQIQIARLDAWPELQGIARLAALDWPSPGSAVELPDPATAMLTPIDDRLLSAVEFAYRDLQPSAPELQRTRAHAYLARIHIEAIHSLGLAPGRPLPPLARLLAGRALHHGRQFCRFYWHRRVAGLERVFSDTELELLALTVDLENTPHAGDPASLAVERQLVREYLERSGPRDRIAALARRRADAGALDTDLLLPFVHELDRLIDHRLVEMALVRAMQKGGEPDGYGLDPVIAVITEDLRARDLREYERRLASRAERARQTVPRVRHDSGKRELGLELPLEWPSAAVTADLAREWLGLAHARSPDFGRRHAVARAKRMLSDRPDALIELLGRGGADPVVANFAPQLLAALDAVDGESLAGLRVRVELSSRSGSRPELSSNAEARTRQAFALATRDALMHPR